MRKLASTLSCILFGIFAVLFILLFMVFQWPATVWEYWLDLFDDWVSEMDDYQ